MQFQTFSLFIPRGVKVNTGFKTSEKAEVKSGIRDITRKHDFADNTHCYNQST